MGRKEVRKGEVSHASDRFRRETGWERVRAQAEGHPLLAGRRCACAEQIVAVCGSLRVLGAWIW